MLGSYIMGLVIGGLAGFAFGALWVASKAWPGGITIIVGKAPNPHPPATEGK